MPQPPYLPQTVSQSIASAQLLKAEPPTSILKPGLTPAPIPTQPIQSQEPEAPPPPERGSSYAIMSLRAKEGTKRVSFDTGHQNQEIVHEDPNVNIMLKYYLIKFYNFHHQNKFFCIEKIIM